MSSYCTCIPDPCSCPCGCGDQEIRRLLTVEEIEGLNIERQRGIIYVDRISQCCPACQPFRFRSLRQIV
ncbi:hypothetical protein J7E71_13620 [Mesobacillus foraminis]|uniref:hypothetical protein n=1 Tax=Mesobacillus foraminis TaxID=279826 RepID=UPI001BEA663A|nr:hypothetical protein [Mesobacillus foraminis]MBT2756983.1 hypothetical protein [Mesobacillus foraminis]